MDVKEYLLSLLAIITGLAITDMVVSMHGLLRRFRQVHWDWLPVVAAAFVFVVIVTSWWVSWIAQWEGMSLVEFIIVLCQLIALFLAAKAVLPDDKDVDQLDLLDYYRRSNRYVWISVSAIPIFMIAQAVYSWQAVIRRPAEALLWATPLIIYCALSLALAWVQRMTVHRLLVPVLLIVFLIINGARTLQTSS